MFCSSKTGLIRGGGSRRESNPGHLWLEPPVRCHWATTTTAGQPPTLTILYIYCTCRWYFFFTFLYFRLITSLFPACGKMVLAFRVRKPHSMGSFLTDRVFQSTPDGTYWVAVRCVTEAFSTTCAVHMENCGGWWLSSCRGSVAEHWQLKPEVSWVWLPAAASLFHFPLFSPHNIQIHSLVTF